MQAGAATLKLLADISDLKAKMAEVERITQQASGRATSGFQGMQLAAARGFGGLLAAAGTAATAIAGVVAVVGTLGFALKGIRDLDAFNDVADSTGATIEQLAKLERIARLNGGTLETVQTALLKLNKGLSEGDAESPTAIALEAIGLNAEKLKKLDPAVALNQVAASLAGYADNGNKARIIQELFGKSTKELASFLKDAAAGGGENAKVIAEQTEKAEAFQKQLAAFKTGIEDIGRALSITLLPAANAVIGAMNTLFGSQTQQQQAQDLIDRLAKQEIILARIQDEVDDPSTGSAKRQARTKDLEKQLALVQGLRKEVEKLQSTLPKAPEEPLKTVGSTDAIKARKDALKELAKAEADRLKLEKEQLATRDLRRQTAYDKAEQDAEEALIKAKQDLDAATRKALDASLQELAAIEKTNRALELETEEIGLTKQALAELTAARLRDNAAVLEAQGLNSDDETKLRQAAALRRQAELIIAKEARQANVDAAEQSRQEWVKTFEQIGEALTTEIMRGGKNAGRLLKDYFKTLVLQPIIKAIVNPITGAITSALGLGSTAAQAGQGGSDALSSLGSLASIGTMAGAMGSAFAGGVSATLAGGFASTALAIEGGMAAIAAGTATSIGVGLSTIAGALGPYALAAAALYAVYKALDKSGTPTRGADVFSSGTSVADPLAGTVTSRFGTDAAFQNERVAQTEQFLAPLALSSAQALNKLSALTGGVKQFAVGLQFAIDGVEDTRGAIKLFADGAVLAAKEELKFTQDLQQATKEFTGELALSLVDAIQQTITLPKQLADELSVLRTQVGGPTIEAVAAFTDKVVALMTASKQMADAFKLLPGSFSKIAGLSDELRIKLADLFGGFQNASAAIGRYYEAFYSESERAAFTTAQLTATLKSLGINTLPATRDAFRALVDAQDLTTESGRGTYAALIAVSDAFAQVTPVVEAASLSMEQMVSNAESALRRAYEAEAGRLGAIIEQANEARSAYQAGLQREIDGLKQLEQVLRDAFTRDSSALEQTISGLGELDKSLEDFISGINSTIAQANIGSFAFARDQFERRLAEVQAGNTDAIPGLISAGDAYAQAALNNASDKAEYLTILASIRTGAESAKSATKTAQDVAKDQLKTLRDQVAKLIDIDDGTITVARAVAGLSPNIQAQLTGILGVDTRVESVAQAIRLLETAEQATGTRQVLADQLQQLIGRTPGLEELKANFITATQAAAQAEAELAILNAQVGSLITINESVLSVRDAILALQLARGGGAAIDQAITSASQSTYGNKVDTYEALEATGLSDLQIRARVEKLLGPQTDYDWLRLRAGAVSDNSVGDKVALYRDGLQAGFSSSELRTAVESVLGKQSDRNWMDLEKLAGFATGGYYPGGMALVGEQGPELINFRNPGQVYTNDQSMRMMMMGEDNREMVAEMRALREEVAMLRANTQATAVATSKTAELLYRATDGGDDALTVRMEAA
jgi:hypothetical protein